MFENKWLIRKLTLRDLAEIPERATNEGLVLGEALGVPSVVLEVTALTLIAQRLDGALVVVRRSLRDESHGTIALEVVDRDDGCVDGELLVVHAETVSVGVRIREQARLEDGVCRGLDVGDEMGGRERDLWMLKGTVSSE